MYKRILVPVDGSDISSHCLGQAIQLAKEQNAQLRVVFVVDTMLIDTFESPEALDAYVSATLAMGKRVLDTAKARAVKAEVKVTTKLVEIAIYGDRVAQMIVKEAEAWPADVIVMGTHGRRGLNHFFLGSVAEGVVRSAKLPVLLIHGAKSKTGKSRADSR
jgi:nucleotide-binding universal stress UspA family protein